MLSPYELIFSAVGLSVLCLFFSRTLAIGVFFSISMLMIFQAWLQVINVDGSWPPNQPRVENYQMSRERVKKLDNLIDANMTKSEWEDYRRCRYLNVCVRRFQSIAELRSKNN